MDLNEIKKELKEKLSEDRYEHTLRVYDTAIQLANMYNESTEKVTIAALLHDYAKCESKQRLKQLIEKYHLPNELLQFHQELWHGPVGAMVAKEKFHITDEKVLHSIYYHTTGRANMSKLELIIFVADYIEPARNFPGVDEVRKLAKNDLKAAARKALQNTIVFLMEKGATIYPDTFLAYNDLTK